MRKVLSSVIIVLVVGVLFGYGLGWIMQPQKSAVDEQISIPLEEPLPERSVQIYKAAPADALLVVESVSIPGCEEDVDCIASILEQLVQPSASGAGAVLPEQTSILNIELENDLARVDLSRHATDLHPGGSSSELMTIYAIANSINENFPYVRQVQLLIEGEVRKTLKGHARIDQPIYADATYLRAPLTAETDSGKALTVESLVEEAIEDKSN